MNLGLCADGLMTALTRSGTSDMCRHNGNIVPATASQRAYFTTISPARAMTAMLPAASVGVARTRTPDGMRAAVDGCPPWPGPPPLSDP